MIFRIAIYQPVVMSYQARCYGISALRQEKYQVECMVSQLSRHQVTLVQETINAASIESNA